MSTILLFGSTGGIGETFARAFHNMGKKVIITGRREARLTELAQELVWPGGVRQGQQRHCCPARTYQDSHLQIPRYQHRLGQFRHPISRKLRVTRQFFGREDRRRAEHQFDCDAHPGPPPHSSRKRETILMITSSSLAYLPSGMFPIYCPTKAAVHSFLVGVRETVKNTNLNVIEIAPPYVRTDLDAANRQDKALMPMKLDDYTNQTLEILKKPAWEIKEAAVGFPEMVSSKWREA